ncbi:MAG: glycerol-3-phosphate 1-O-acyltransferase PlsB [Betaproteobacteria bacterium]
MAGFFELPGWVVPLARRVLYFWVRTSVFPALPQELGLDPAKPVCYVLQDHHLSNLLVLFEETQCAKLPSAEAPLRTGNLGFAHSVFSLNRKHSITASARERYAHPPLMTALIKEALAVPDFEVQIVPVIILWGRRPDKQESILKALFSETWRQPGPLRRLLTILLHGRNVLVRFNAPISLRDLSSEGLDEAQALRKLSRVLRVHFRRQRQMAIGPDLSHRNTQTEAVLSSSAVRSAIAIDAETQHISIDEAQRRARRFALEIASDYSYGTLRAFELFLSWLWSRLYDGIELHHIEVVTKIAPSQGIVYVPTHRSHIDYLLLSYLLHKQGLTPPHIAAGANLNMPLIGLLLRRCGAFFLRRSFKGEPLYAAVFHEYLHLILTRGFPLEYFIEGGRSRNGRTLAPKAGILGMTVRSFIREHTRPLVFVPVYIGYEKIMEGRTYVRELAGKPKQKESLWNVLQSARQIKKVFGKVHVNFGEPLGLNDFLEICRPGWSQGATEATNDWPREATSRAATELATRLNSAAVINPVNLIALALLATPRHTLDEHVLNRLIEHYHALAIDAPYAPSSISCPLQSTQIVAYAERLGIAERIPHPLGDLIGIRENETATLAYFRNNVLHLFALPSLIACLLSNNHQLDMARISAAVSGIYGLMKSELFLRWEPEQLPAATAAIIEVFVGRGLLQRADTGEISAPEANSEAFAELRLLGETIRPMLERHFLTLAVLQHGGSNCQTRHTLETDCHLLAQRLTLLYASTSEHSEISTFSALIAHLIDADLISEDQSGLLHFDQRLTTPLEHAELVLASEARQTIRRMTRTGWHNLRSGV